MQRQFLLVEGVNIYNNLYDTDQLSVIRGGSFLYKQAIIDIEQVFSDDVERGISTGASSGLFLLKNDVDENDIVDRVQSFLKRETKPKKSENATDVVEEQYYHFLTFGVVCCQATDLLQAKEKLQSKLRYQQLQGFSLIPDHALSGYDDQLSGEVCWLTGSAIAAKNRRRTVQSDTPISLSASAFHRREYGREQKHSYYNELIDNKALQANLQHFTFAGDIEALCEHPGNKLSGKMAVIYIDGNKFSKRQREFISQYSSIEEQIKAQENFDTEIQRQRREFLESELSLLIKHNQTADNIIRLETLLWGGDEMLFVMPAWEGFAFLQRFFAHQWVLQGVELTHAAGIVFCQANTPIRIIQALAKDLAERVKEESRTENGWDYLVLESVDYPTNESLSDYFNERYNKHTTKPRQARLPALADWEAQQTMLAELCSGSVMSRSQLYRIVNALKATEKAGGRQSEDGVISWSSVLEMDSVEYANATPQVRAEYRLYEVSKNKDTIRGKLPVYAEEWFNLTFDNPHDRAWFWLHLVELWDYLAPEAEALSKTAAQEADL